MNSRDFVYWLQGFLEINSASGKEKASQKVNEKANLTVGQLDCIQKHLNLVFKHEIDPSFGDNQEELNNIHHGYENDGDPLLRC